MKQECETCNGTGKVERPENEVSDEHGTRGPKYYVDENYILHVQWVERIGILDGKELGDIREIIKKGVVSDDI